MTNVYFSDEQIKSDDVYFVCYMIERIARQLKQPNKYVANKIGHDGLAKKLSLAGVLHSENPLAVEADWIDEYQMQKGNFDVEDVDKELCPRIPTATQMGKVYKRLVMSVVQGNEDLADTLLRVYNSPICETLDNYSCGAYYEPSPYITRSFYAGGFY